MNELEFKKYSLGSDKARETHRNIININNGYSLTITSNPRNNSLPVNEQYTKLNRDLLTIFKELGHYYNLLMWSPEFTKDYNIHFHVYFKTDVEDIQIFEQNFKKSKKFSKNIGFMYKLKKIDSLSPELTDYPFKDIDRTLKYSTIENCLFHPYHYVIKGSTTRLVNSPQVGNIDINKFLQFVNSHKNI